MRWLAVCGACLTAVAVVACSASGPGRQPWTSTQARPHTHLPVCPGAGGDAVPPEPTFVSPIDPSARGRITVLARTTVDRPTIVRAVVTTLTDNHVAPAIPTLVRSRIVLVRRVWETVGKARGVPPPTGSDVTLRGNVIASSRLVRTTGLRDHPLTMTVPAKLRARDYFVVAIQRFTEQCTSRDTAYTEDLIGLVRVSVASPGAASSPAITAAGTGGHLTLHVGEQRRIRLVPREPPGQMWRPISVSSPGIVDLIAASGGYPRIPVYSVVVVGTHIGATRLYSITDEACLHAPQPCLPPQQGFQLAATVQP